MDSLWSNANRLAEDLETQTKLWGTDSGLQPDSLHPQILMLSSNAEKKKTLPVIEKGVMSGLCCISLSKLRSLVLGIEVIF
jgi:hypothetical protein